MLFYQQKVKGESKNLSHTHRSCRETRSVVEKSLLRVTAHHFLLYSLLERGDHVMTVKLLSNKLFPVILANSCR